MAELKVNSLRVRFENGSAEPTDADIFAFMRDKMKLRSDDLLSMYKDKPTMSVIIKFKTEEDMLGALRRLPGTMDFVIDKYRSCKVTLSAANSVVRYVRVFNLPPEIEDKEIWGVMSKYGNIQRMVRETYGAETGYPIWTSVRGLYVELKEGEEIPASINVRNIRARVFYDGLVNKCYQCGSTEHIKAECPERKSVNERLNTAQTASYSGALKGAWNKPRKVSDQEEKGEKGKMTNLNALISTSSSSSVSKCLPSNDEGKGGVAQAARNIEQNKQTEPNEITNTANTSEQGHTKPMEAGGASLTTGADGEEEDGARGFSAPLSTDEGEVMDVETASLKRGRADDKNNANAGTDDSALSDISNPEKEKNGESSTISGWQKVSTRNRNKQLKLSEGHGRSKSATSRH